MLTIKIPERELYDENKSQFLFVPRTELHLEHSLISLSKWESKWKKPFLSNEEPSKKEYTDYIRCMSIDKEISLETVDALAYEDFVKIKDYIGDPYTATKIYDRRPKKGGKAEIMTAEVIYYYMIYYGIPFACEKWHLNRLITLIRVCGIKGGTTNQAMDMNAIFAQNRSLNAARRAGR